VLLSVHVDRRTFLKGAGLTGITFGVGNGLGHPGRRPGRAFGEVPLGAETAIVAPRLRAENILELFLYGGVSQYESFYCVPEHGAVDGEGWSLFLKSGDVQAALDKCGTSGPLLQPFALDADGQMVQFGPFAMPLRNRPDVMARMRVSITAHDLEPHEGAIPLALAGRRLGDASMAGLGAHIQRYFLDRNSIQGRAPFAYILRPQSPGFPTDNVSAATAIGFHPGAARPLAVQVDAAGDLGKMLARSGVGENRAAYDAAMQEYIREYEARLAFRGRGGPIRAARLTDLTAEASAIANAGALRDVLDPRYLASVQATACGVTHTDASTMSLRLATHLLTHPVAPAKYVCVIDGGLLMADGGGGYDSHKENSHTQARNLGHTLTQLMSLINEPGEHDPAKLDLDRTLILLTTEFGRSPEAQDHGKGRRHWPYGYPVSFIGGPIQSRGVFGACGPDSRATLASSPQENRIAALLALGIWPFEPESYRVADVPGASSHLTAAQLVLKRQLGIG
jgi:hypothetical protein